MKDEGGRRFLISSLILHLSSFIRVAATVFALP
jgi:hypothetical protein